MDLCENCQELTYSFTMPMTRRERRWKTKKTILLHHASIRCQLCQMFHDHLLRLGDNTECMLCDGPHINSLSSTLQSVTLLLDIFECKEYEDDVSTQRYSQCIIEYRGNDDKQLVSGHITLELWADEESAASEKLITQPPLFVHSLEAVTRLALSWLQNCKSSHEECATVEHTPLPSRVLAISGDLDMPSVKLIETEEMTGRYCALSHCWGSGHERPLRTLCDNFRQHLSNIAFESLPLTFQHAVLLVRSIGIPYLWIDSLCIVQDNYQDWEKEAKEMGTIYSGAVFVIAAAGAKDSTEGLFNMELTEPVIIQAPYISDGIEKGYYNIAAELQYRRSLHYEAPLLRRAWCFQELYLARGVTAFMPGAVSWTCKAGCISERGISEDPSTMMGESWFQILRMFTRRALTFPSDRLHALKGVASELQKTRPDSFLFDHGIWKDQICEQLFWRRTRRHNEDDSLPLPSWCWAATGGPKIWLYQDEREIRGAMPKSITIDDCGSLIVAGSMTKAALTFYPLFKEVENQLPHHFPGAFLLSGWESDGDSTFPYILTRELGENDIVGIGVFDADPVIDARCFFLVADTRKFGEPPKHIPPTLSLQTMLPKAASEGSLQQPQGLLLGQKSLPQPGRTETGTDASDIVPVPIQGTMLAAPTTIRQTEMSDASGIASNSSDIDATRANVPIPKPPSFQPNHDEYREHRNVDQEDNTKQKFIFTKNCQEPDESMLDPPRKMDSSPELQLEELIRISKTNDDVHWTLLLEPVDKNTYRRVGIAILYDQAFNDENVECTEFKIV